MKKALKLLSALLSILLLAQISYAQQAGININGKITNQRSGRPIPLVSISVSKKGIGTSTNAAGRFILIIPAANQADTLKISCIGYQTQQIPIAGLKNEQELNIALEKNTTELQEVTVTYYDAAKIIQKALARIPENYINHPHILRGFYRMYTYNDSIPLQLSEAVFDVFNFGYADKHADIFKLIKARSEKNDRDFSSIEFAQKPNTVFEQDVINHLPTSGFLSEKGLANHQYEVSGVTDINGYRAYEVDFKEKPGSDEKTFRGKMYIDTKTYAFVYFDFGLSPAGLKNPEAASFAERSLSKKNDIKAGVLSDHTKVSYQEVGNKWVLANVDGDDSLAIKSVYLDYNYVAHVKFNYQITAVDTTQKESFDSKIGRNDNINAYKSNSDQKFWKDYNILLSDDNADDIFKHIKAINKQYKEVTQVKNKP